MTPAQFGFYIQNEVFFRQTFFGRLAYTRLAETAHTLWPQFENISIFFIKMTPIEIGFQTNLVKKKFNIGPFWAIWQAPVFPKNGPRSVVSV